MRFTYPLMLDVTDRLVVIIGGGGVAVRKIVALLEAGATRVRVVAPRFHEQLPHEVQRVQERYESRHLDGAGLAFAATDSPEVNDAVVRDARVRGVLVNRLDEGDPPGDFVTPATSRRGAIVIAVTAGSPALSATVRDQLSLRLEDRYVLMAELMLELRPKIRESGLNQQQRAAIFRDLATDEALEELSLRGRDALQNWLTARYPQLKR